MDIGLLFQRIRKNKSNGFSLMEVLVALAVLTVGLLAIFKMHSASTGTNTISRAVTENSIVAAAKAEELLALQYNHPELLAGVHAPKMDEDGIDNNMSGVVDEVGETGILTLRWEVVDDCLGSDLKGHKCIHLRVASNVNNRRMTQIQLDFIKTSM